MSNSDNILLNNRRAFAPRKSIQSIIAYAREQDQKIYMRQKRFNYGRTAGAMTLLLIPSLYLIHNWTIGNWRSIYNGSVVTTSFEVREANFREYFVPEMYLKEREIRKIQLGLKDTQELKNLFQKKQ